jgi:preprotein translocase subunit SecG
MLYNIVLVLHALASVMLIGIVLIQGSKADGLSGFLGGGSTTFFGTSTATVIVKITTVIGIVFMLTSITLTVLHSRRARTVIDRSEIPNSAPLER